MKPRGRRGGESTRFLLGELFKARGAKGRRRQRAQTPEGADARGRRRQRARTPEGADAKGREAPNTARLTAQRRAAITSGAARPLLRRDRFDYRRAPTGRRQRWVGLRDG